MRIITIGREFGSGGRELGKRLADKLEMNYYDKEILTAIAKKLQMDESYISQKADLGFLSAIPVSFGRTFAYRQQDTVKILVEQQNIIREIAEKGEDFVIVGRNADVILKKYQPLKLFVYADMESKIRRCKEREAAQEGTQDKIREELQKTGKAQWQEEELARKIRQVDKGRAKNRELLSGSAWGRKESYDLCVNTSGITIKEIIPAIAEYANIMFRRKG